MGDKMKEINISIIQTLKRGLDNLMLQRGFENYKALSLVSQINYNTLKSWMNGTKLPRLGTLDKMCNTLKIETFKLFTVNPDFSESVDIIENDSRDKIRINISKLMLEKTRLTKNDCIALFEGEITMDEYISYTRRPPGRIVPLNKLGIIAHYLNVQIWELLK